MAYIRSNYKTKQRNLILDFLSEKINQHVTIDMIEEHLRGKVGQTTIYRTLEKLVAEGLALKYTSPNGISSCYQYIENTEGQEQDYHFLCDKCGQLFHIKCDYFYDFTEHLKKEHRFILDNLKTVFYGSCEKCHEN